VRIVSDLSPPSVKRPPGATRPLAPARRFWAIYLGSTLGAFGCGDGVELGARRESSCDLNPDSPNEAAVSFSTFWLTENGDGPARTVLKDRIESTGLAVYETARPGRAGQHESVTQWLTSEEDKTIPSVFQANGGSDLMPFADPTPAPTSQLCPLNQLAVEEHLIDNYFTAAIEPLYCGNTLYALPIGMHRVNVLYVNAPLYQEAQRLALEVDTVLPNASEIQSVDEWIDLLRTVDSLEMVGTSGAPLIPVALDGISNWPLQVLAFDAILASYSADAYRAIWTGRPLGETDEYLQGILERMTEDVATIGAFSNLDERKTWVQNVDLVVQGEALFTVMGDWASSLIYDSSGATSVDIVPFPGDSFVYTVDSFAVPRQWDVNGSGAYAWLTLTAERATQLDFAAAKHAIPPMKGLSEEELAGLGIERLAENYAEFEACEEDPSECRLLLAVSGLGPASGIDPCYEETGPRLAHIAGAPMWDTIEEPLGCDTPWPESAEEARTQLVEKLIEVSRSRFAQECRR
jgi:ABC-type glycerol-3-phosphate transport system substrate-binding protein